MAIIRCKMCGGDMELSADKTIGMCEYCGSTMTLPKGMEDEQRSALFNRGNHFRRLCDFDKALAVYENIVAQDDTDAEAHWCCALCRFGIEYVEDPATLEYIPTCHRASFDSFLEDVDYLAAVEHSDGITRRQYQKDAAKIAEVQRGILATSQTAEPFDVFICYKETDENGQRTRDSMLAQDIYYQLTDEGYRVFFSRITLEEVAGTQYEPYIFSALNSARVMVAVGTKTEHFNAVWVKNEWSRFLALMKTDRTRLLLPCYRDMDPYDLPEQLGVLQSYDMGRIGFVQDLVRGIKKVMDAGEPRTAVVKEVVKETVVAQGGGNVTPLLERVFMFLEDSDWQSANEYCEKVLDIDPKNARAYLGKLMAEMHAKKQEDLKGSAKPFDSNNNYQKAIRFGDDELKRTLEGYIDHIITRNENNRLEELYTKACDAMARAKYEADYKLAAEQFGILGNYKDSAKQAEKCQEARKDAILAGVKWKLARKVVPITDYEGAIQTLKSIPGWKDADEQVALCRRRMDEIRSEQEAARLERDRQLELGRQEAERKAKRNKKLAFIGTALVATLVAIVFIFNTLILPPIKYSEAEALCEQGSFAAAAMMFGELGGYKDAWERSGELWDKVTRRSTLEAGGWHTVGLKSDGTVVAVGYNPGGRCDVSGWTDVVAVSTGIRHTVGLKSDGTVVAVGANYDGQCDVYGWTDIVAVAAGGYHIVGLKSDGTVVAVGENEYGQCDVEGWTDIVAVAAGPLHTVGLKSDGTVVAVGYNKYGQCDVSGWTDMVAVAAGRRYTVGVKSDGTVVAVGYNDDGQCEVSGWTDIVAVATGVNHTVGLKSDGTVVAVGDNEYGQCNVGRWTDIVAVAAGDYHTVGLKSDGTVVSAGNNNAGRCNVSDWTDIKLPQG